MPYILDLVLFVALFGYLGCFLGTAATVGRQYLRSTPNVAGRSTEQLKEEISDYERSENISLQLAGFSLAALTFVISINIQDISTFETLVTFFSLSLVFEITSSLCYHHTEPRLYKYLGFVFQFAGLLAVLDGFFAYLGDKLPADHAQVWLVYLAGLGIFFWLTGKELRNYLGNWILYNAAEKKNSGAKGHV